ncbi:hypothetical protein [Methanospirillum lacunae]|nr:hypothetical protein [Methanospirillum lacunae]
MNRTFARCSSLILIFLIIRSSFHSGDHLSAAGITGFFVIGEISIVVMMVCLSLLFTRFQPDHHVANRSSGMLSHQFRLAHV